jgi:SAM-dependent methyltransferase
LNAEAVGQVVRRALPFDFGRVALIGVDPGAAGLPGAEPAAGTSGRALEAAHRLRDEGVEYLVLAGAEAPAALLDEFRLVRREPGVCDVIALAERVRIRPQASDGLPYPPPEMMRVVAGLNSPHRFYRRFFTSGAAVAERIAAMSHAAGASLESREAVLDFGCGCGRVMRHWRDLRGPALHGTDYNRYLVEWCRAHLPFASFEVNGLEPRLEYPDEAFDLVYSYSVFTHLPEAMQLPWMEELARVTRPCGHIFVTLHGESRIRPLDEDQRRRFVAGDLVVVSGDERDWGTNACGAYHPDAWVRDTLAGELDVMAHVPADELVPQDSYLMRRPARPPAAASG